MHRGGNSCWSSCHVASRHLWLSDRFNIFSPPVYNRYSFPLHYRRIFTPKNGTIEKSRILPRPPPIILNFYQVNEIIIRSYYWKLPFSSHSFLFSLSLSIRVRGLSMLIFSPLFIIVFKAAHKRITKRVSPPWRGRTNIKISLRWIRIRLGVR